MKNIILDGRIGKDGAEVRQTRLGKDYVRFSLANNSFVGGVEKTEWYDVTSYDPYVIENKIKFLGKGCYVIVSGNINTEVNVKDGKVWVNHYITANSIDIPSLKKKDDESESQIQLQEPSVTTPGGRSENFLNDEHIKEKVYEYATTNGGSSVNDDDLPF